MSAYPCTKLTIHENILVTIHGPYISTFDLSSGLLLQSTAPPTSPSRETISSAFSIINFAVTLPRRRLVSVDQQKSLKVWDLDTLHILSSRELPKKANQVLLTDNGETILVADKFGDVFSYPLVAPEIPKVERKVKPNTQEGRKSLISHSNPSLGKLVLGHTSSLTTMLLTPDDRYLITADRDEHIRVSQYPRGYNIERFCMGHTKYVSALHLPQNLPGTLMSAGGDRHLLLWDYISGQLKGRLEIGDVVYASTKVSSQRRKFKRLEAKAGTGWRARRRKEREMKEEEERTKREREKQGGSMLVEKGVPDEDVEMLAAEDRPDGVTTPRTEFPPSSPHEPGKLFSESNAADTHFPGGMTVGATRARLPALEDVIVISQIATVQFESKYALIFSAVGANAIFFAPCDASTRWDPEEHVHQFNLPYPVLSFDVELLPPKLANPSYRNRIWVTVDQTFVEHGTNASESSKETGPLNNDSMESRIEIGEAPTGSSISFYVLEWQGGSTMNEVSTDLVPLLHTLRSFTPISASSADIQALDLYGLLTSLPKTEELEEVDGLGQEEQVDFSEKSEQGPVAKTEEDDQTSIENRVRPSAENMKERLQSRQVKKSGRKKWQDKMESRQQALAQGSQAGSASKNKPSDDLSPSRTITNQESAEFEAQVYEHMKDASKPTSGGILGTVRKASGAGDSDKPSRKRIRVDDG